MLVRQSGTSYQFVIMVDERTCPTEGQIRSAVMFSRDDKCEVDRIGVSDWKQFVLTFSNRVSVGATDLTLLHIFR